MTYFADKIIENKILKRTGIVDIGSNTIRLVVFEGPSRSPRYFYNEKVNCGLGLGLRLKGYLSNKSQKRAYKAIQRFNAVIKTMEIFETIFVATSAVRDATNGKEFIKKLEKNFNIKINIITGKEEGMLAASGVLLSWPKATGVVCDIGGSSLELAFVENGKIKITQSFEIGPLALQDYNKIGKSSFEIVKEKLSKIDQSFPNDVNSLFLVGGCWRAMAKIHMNLTNYPLKVLQGYEVSVNNFDSTIENICNLKISELLKYTTSSEERVRLLPYACKVLIAILEKFRIKKLVFSGSSGPIYGWKATLDRYKKTYSDKEKMGKLKFEILNVIALSPEVIQLQGKFNLTRSIGDAFGYFTLNWIKVKNRWYIISDHTSGSN